MRAQPIFQPLYRLAVDVVGRFVQNQQFARGKQRAGQRNAAPLAPREVLDARIGIGQPQARQYVFGLLCTRLALLGRHRREHLFEHPGPLWEYRVCGRYPMRTPGMRVTVPGVGLLHPRQQAQQRGLARAVDSTTPIFCPVSMCSVASLSSMRSPYDWQIPSAESNIMSDPLLSPVRAPRNRLPVA